MSVVKYVDLSNAAEYGDGTSESPFNFVHLNDHINAGLSDDHVFRCRGVNRVTYLYCFWSETKKMTFEAWNLKLYGPYGFIAEKT